MGHLVGKDIYRKLGKKLDGLTMRAPWNDTLFEILKELYTTKEAELIIKMPYGISTLDQIVKTTGFEKRDVEQLLDDMCDKGLVMDIWGRGEYHYTISPFIIGIFEFTMMRTQGKLDTKKMAKLFHEYMIEKQDFFKANMGKGQTMSPLRVIPHEDTLDDSAFVEILDFEKARSIVDQAKTCAVGICSCRHEKHHRDEKKCNTPLETCTSFGSAADYLIRHNLAKEISHDEMKDILFRSREKKLVFSADNVQKDISFICHCCSCCCNIINCINQFGYTNIVVTSNYIAKIDEDLCIQCDNCIEACPVNAISNGNNGDTPVVDESLCLGCGVCALDCQSESLKLVQRKQRIQYPEDTFERVILQSLEQGNLQNLIFSNPNKTNQYFLRSLLGGILKLPPVKKSLLGDKLRSRFINSIRR